MKQQKQNKKNTYEDNIGDWDTETDNYLVAIFHWDIY
jgi:hypothetical protein